MHGSKHPPLAGILQGRPRKKLIRLEEGFMSATVETLPRTPIKVVPHFSRLHEWIALEERYYQDEGLEPECFPT
jgi:hypothetical protein